MTRERSYRVQGGRFCSGELAVVDEVSNKASDTINLFQQANHLLLHNVPRP
jgi:hypothetical protein